MKMTYKLKNQSWFTLIYSKINNNPFNNSLFVPAHFLSRYLIFVFLQKKLFFFPIYLFFFLLFFSSPMVLFFFYFPFFFFSLTLSHFNTLFLHVCLPSILFFKNKNKKVFVC